MYTAATRFLVAGQLGNTAISMAAQPRFTELFAVGDRRGANTVYQTTTAWLVVLTWPLYLLAMIYAPAVLAVFGHAYHAGAAVMLILGCAMLVATGCGLVDMVLTTTGRTTLEPRQRAARGHRERRGRSGAHPEVRDDRRRHRLGRGDRRHEPHAARAGGGCRADAPVRPCHDSARAPRRPVLRGDPAARADGRGYTGAPGRAGGRRLAASSYALGLWRLRDDLHLSAMPGFARIARLPRARARQRE